MILKAQSLLKNIFGYESFRSLQKEIICNVLSRKDTLVIMPTGGGKSLCYQIPAIIFNGFTIVVSPLISLMKDQVEQLASLGVPTVYLNSSLPKEQYRITKERVKQGDVKLLYVAPETLLMPGMLNFLQKLPVECIAIDEAHCISEWGHEFRPEYRQLIAVREKFPKAVCIALTATATPQVQNDIKHCLGFKTSDTFIASFNRENLFLQIVPKTDPYFQITDFLDKYPDQSGIIYCFSRKQVDTLSHDLATEGYSVRPYHAGLDDAIRKINQEAFIRDDTRIMVATIAFGMGINKPNVRFIIHHDLPKNIESYYQQIGRSGRDGLRAHCLLLFGYNDLQKINYFIGQMSDSEKQAAEQHLNALVKFAESYSCRRKALLTYFGEKTDIQNCGMCDNCLGQGKALEDITVQAQMFLSCIKRTRESFGAGHIIDILRGSQSKKVIRFGHHRLRTYGIGADFSRNAWKHYSRQFIAQSLLYQDLENMTLKLTDKAWRVLKKLEPVMGTHMSEMIDYSRIKDEGLDYDPVLLDLLRRQRKKLADDEDVPPYVIFPDRTLIQMATVCPRSKEALRGIYGIGQVKMKNYGAIFLDLINHYRENNDNRQQSFQLSRRARLPSNRQRRFIEVGEAYDKGSSIAALMRQFQIKQVTILSYLYRYLQSGFSIREDGLIALCSLNQRDQKRVTDIFKRLGFERLTPVYEALNGEVAYEELHLMRLITMIKAANRKFNIKI